MGEGRQEGEMEGEWRREEGEERGEECMLGEKRSSPISTFPESIAGREFSSKSFYDYCNVDGRYFNNLKLTFKLRIGLLLPPAHGLIFLYIFQTYFLLGFCALVTLAPLYTSLHCVLCSVQCLMCSV